MLEPEVCRPMAQPDSVIVTLRWTDGVDSRHGARNGTGERRMRAADLLQQGVHPAEIARRVGAPLENYSHPGSRHAGRRRIS
jgi:hypothetical protein